MLPKLIELHQNQNTAEKNKAANNDKNHLAVIPFEQFNISLILKYS